MNIQTVKIDLVQKLLTVKSEEVLNKINRILDKEVIVAYTVDGKSLTQEQYNKSLREAEKEIDAGDFITQEELEKKSAEWKKRK
jgi:hypothetical protein